MSVALGSTAIDEILDVDLETGTDLTAATNATPVVITATAHGLTVGDWVKVANALGNVGANGFWRVSVVADANTATLAGSVGNSAWTSGGKVQKVTSGLVRQLKPGNLNDLQDTLNRRAYARTSVANRSQESNLATIFTSGLS